MNQSTSTVRRVVLAAAGLSATLALTLGTTTLAGADPDPSHPGTAPAGVSDPTKIYVGQGADAFAELTNNLASQYNPQRAAGSAQLASYDAINPQTGAAGETITPKPGCSGPRLNGANAGITEITKNTKSTTDASAYCLDFVRASRAKNAASSAESNLTFYAQSRDAVGYATVGNAYAPTTPLSKGQLKDIFECRTLDWSEVGGQKGTIHVYTPPTSSATYTFFLTAIGSSLTAVNSGCGAGGTIGSQQNDGRSLAGDPQGISPYAITKWAAQSNEAPGIADLRGGAALGLIAPAGATRPAGGWTQPTTTTQLDGAPYQVLNPAFTAQNPSFGRLFWNAVRNDAPADLKAVFAPGGYLCTHQDDLLIPFGNTPLGSDSSASEYCGLAQ